MANVSRQIPHWLPTADHAVVGLGDAAGAAQLNGHAQPHAQPLGEDVDAVPHAGQVRSGQLGQGKGA
jgi:hypothetical protein